VFVRSVSVRVLTGECKVPGENKVKCLLFGMKNAKGIIRART